jgi:hypothetical protein
VAVLRAHVHRSVASDRGGGSHGSDERRGIDVADGREGPLLCAVRVERVEVAVVRADIHGSIDPDGW